jgi:hypothetical protein
MIPISVLVATDLNVRQEVTDGIPRLRNGVVKDTSKREVPDRFLPRLWRHEQQR